MSRRSRIGICVTASLLFACLLIFPIRDFLPSSLNIFQKHHCASKHEPYHAPRRNIWADIEVNEFEAILDYLYTVPNDLNLTREANATSWDNHVAVIEVLHPNKSDAITFLDTDGPAAPRYARLIVNQGATEHAGLLEYSVGPLPPSEKTKIEPLIWPYNSGRNKVNNPLPNYEEIVEWFAALGNEVSDIVDDLLGDIVHHPQFSGDMPPFMALSRPATFTDNYTVSSWASVHATGERFDAWSLLDQGLFCKFEISGRDSSKWKINEWFYNGVLYNSTETFRKAWKSGEVKKLPANMDGEWTAAEPNKNGWPGREKPAPVMIAPTGARWKVDKEEKHVSWMGFEFYISTLQATAMKLWNIQFRGERVMYELGLQECIAHYAGEDPMTIGMMWMDTLFGMGSGMYELVPGFDCPSYATYLDTSYRKGEKAFTNKNSICIFEYTADYPLHRHTSPDHVTISRNNYLVVRSVSTVGNYDYTIDYIFYLDGTIEVKVRASGYIFAAYHQLEAIRKDFTIQKRGIAAYDYGYQVHDQIVALMHDHVLNFKADLDIAGGANTLYKIDVAPFTHQYLWDDSPRNTMRLEHHAVETESALDWPPNSGAIYAVLNNESTNAWGEARGYRIVPGTGMGTPPHLTMKNSSSLGRAGSWAYHDLHVLRQHDAEQRSGNEYNAMEPLDPLIDFSKYLNDEDTVQRDIVMYFNLGSHHVPHSGDIPNTLMHTSWTSVMFVPQNWADRDPSRDSAQGVKISFEAQAHSEEAGKTCAKSKGNVGKGKKGTTVERFGGAYEHDVKVGKEALSPDLRRYGADGEVVVGVAMLAWNETLAAM